MKIELEKLHVCQSDFLVCLNADIENKQGLAKQICARRTGIGADGAVIISKIEQNTVYSEFYNADGSCAYMSESAAKACAQSLFINNAINGDFVRIISKNSSCEIQRLSPELLQSGVAPQSFSPRKIVPLNSQTPLINTLCEVRGGGVYVTAVYSGMPFAAVFTDNLYGINLAERGASFQNSRLFQNGINLVFIQIVDNSAMRIRIYRHGCGELPSCGSAALAAHAAAARLKLCNKAQVAVISEGGALTAFVKNRKAGVLSSVHKIASFTREV